MPKIQCSKCGKWYYGWALIYKSCLCECGERLNRIELGKDTYVKR